jgi:hypothetical protein
MIGEEAAEVTGRSSKPILHKQERGIQQIVPNNALNVYRRKLGDLQQQFVAISALAVQRRKIS